MIEVNVDIDALAIALAERLQPTEGTPWLTTAEAVEYVRMSRATLERFVAAETIPFSRLDTGRLLFNRHDLDSWLASHRRGA